MTEEQSGHDKGLSKTKNIQTDQNTRRAAEEREGMGQHERSALPKTGMGEKPDAGYWDQMKPEDSSDMSMNKSRFGVFEKEGGTGPSVAKEGTDYNKDVRSMNQSGIYAEKDAKTWKDMAKSGESKAGESKGASEKEEMGPEGTKGQHWRGEPWEKNPKVGGREMTESGSGTSGQHWRGEDVPTEKTGKKGESSASKSDKS